MEVNVNLPVRRSVRFCPGQNIPRVFNFFFFCYYTRANNPFLFSGITFFHTIFVI